MSLFITRVSEYSPHMPTQTIALLSSGVGGGEDAEGAFGSTRGTCEAMCPTSEVERRVRLDDFDDLEKPPPGDRTTSPTALLVKRFARTIVSAVCAHWHVGGFCKVEDSHVDLLQNMRPAVHQTPGLSFA